MFYDGTKLLSLLDLNRQKPDIYICTSNRSAGKTTFFNRYAFNRFFKRSQKTVFLYRFNYELSGCADKIFREIGRLFFPDYQLFSKACGKGIYHELFIGKKTDAENWKNTFAPCGYAVALNNAEQVKKVSHLMADASLMIFDEFQSENGKYCPDEVQKFISLHTSLARGNGQQVKRLPVIMISNPVTIINPYYLLLGISDRLRSNTVFMRGDGYVLEQSFNQSASDAQKQSAFNRAFSDHKYVAYAGESVYLNDNQIFIERPTGRSYYLCTIKYDGKEYGVREFTELSVIYADAAPDPSCKYKIVCTIDDHDTSCTLVKKSDPVIATMRWFFQKGRFRFSDQKAKSAVYHTIGIT